MGISPLQPRLPGEQYLKTFAAKFRVQQAVDLRTSPFSYQPLPTYRSEVSARFQTSPPFTINLKA